MATEILRRQFRQRMLVDKSSRFSYDVANVRYLTSGEVAAALRPFYFSVHPDLFGKYPSERATNETSLQSLSSYIQSLLQHSHPRPTKLTFYLRPHGSNDHQKGHFKSVNIALAQPDIRKTVVSILSTCNLPTTYVDNIAIPKNEWKKRSPEEIFREKMKHYQEQEYRPNPEAELRKVKKNTLLVWLSDNVELSREKSASLEPVQEEVSRLRVNLCRDLGLKAVLWECGWNLSHFRGCLIAFQALAEHHEGAMSVLRERTLVFGNDTGVSFDGQVLLNMGEVRNNWLHFIKNVVREQDSALKTVPLYEKTLSRALKDIQVVRRKFQPRTMAKTYEENLIRMTTSLSDYRGMRGYPKTWPDSLSKYELVVETESGPMMVSPTGQFILPCSCPAFLIVNFINDHITLATERLDRYQQIKEVEKRLHSECILVFGLVSLKKDDSIAPEVMISCCANLLKHSNELNGFLAGIDLTVTNYYSVMSDGQMCIPWNWKLS